MGAQQAKDLRPINVNPTITHSINPNINPNAARIATISGIKQRQRQKFVQNIFIEHNGSYINSYFN
jgi:aerobic-type carbon monoxide dehydrogenase small subunit (CoxS/CutS family)